MQNGVLKKELRIVEKKGSSHALDFPNIFKIEWIKIVLRIIHDGSIWLENGPFKIKKKIVHSVIGYTTLDRPKTMRRESKEII